MPAREKQQLTVHLPGDSAAGLDQDEEYCLVETDGERRRIRFHDYGEVFSVPGLYEHLFAERLCCNSPQVVTGLLDEELRAAGQDPGDLTALDFGAGNGLVAAELAEIGVDRIIGLDLLEEARDAAERDRPGLYDEYLVTDMTAPTEDDMELLEEQDINCLTCVAALGFGDVPPQAFANAFNLVSTPGWIAFNIRERFVGEADESGFATFLGQMLEEGTISERARLRYRHRLAVDGTPLHYVAMVAEKHADVAA